MSGGERDLQDKTEKYTVWKQWTPSAYSLGDSRIWGNKDWNRFR